MISCFIQWAQHMNKQRFVLISSLLAIALKQMIFALLLGIQWFEKQNVKRWKIQTFNEHIAFPVLLFFNLFQVMITPIGQYNKKIRHEENKPKAYTEAQKNLCIIILQWKSSFKGWYGFPTWGFLYFISASRTSCPFFCYRLHHSQRILSEFYREVLSPQP